MGKSKLSRAIAVLCLLIFSMAMIGPLHVYATEELKGHPQKQDSTSSPLVEETENLGEGSEENPSEQPQQGQNETMIPKEEVDGPESQLPEDAADIPKTAVRKSTPYAAMNRPANLTPIMGQAVASKAQMIEYLLKNNPNKDYDYANKFVNWTFQEAAKENIKADVAFALMMKETGFLKYGGDVKEEQNNFGGIGAVGGGVGGASFDSIQIGIRAVIQHLKAYATSDPLNQECVDPRYHLVTKGSAPNVEDLGGRWAVPGYDSIKYSNIDEAFLNDDTYGQHIVTMVDTIKGIKETTYIPTELKQFSVSPGTYIGDSYRVKTNGISTNGVLYEYWVRDWSTGRWTRLKDYSEDGTLIWTPEKSGSYRLEVHIKDKQSTEYFEDLAYQDVEVKTVPPAKINRLSVKEGGYTNTPYTLKTDGTSVHGVLYEYWVRDWSTGRWTRLKDYSGDGTLTWTPKKSGSYRLEVHVKDKKSGAYFEDFAYQDIEVKTVPPAKVNRFSVQEGGYTNTPYTLKTEAASMNGALYEYWVRDWSTGRWTRLKDYSGDGTLAWTPEKGGSYRLEVHVKDKNSSAYYEGYAYKDIEVKGTKINKFTVNEGRYAGKPYTMKVTGESGNGTLYEYWVRDWSTGRWTRLGDYSTSTTFTWVPNKIGRYRLEVHAKDKKSSAYYESYAYKDVEVTSHVLTNKYIVLDAGHGGTQPGATANGYVEKDLNARLTKRIANHLTSFGAKIGYTRNPDEDRTVSLQERVNKANNENADLFLSIHHDSFTNNTTNGMTTFYSSNRPGGNVDPNAVQRSQELASDLVNSMASLGFNNRGSKDSNFYVTRWTNMPSVLIEAGFISNPEEVEKVADPVMQDSIARKIVESIIRFFTI